MALARLTWSTAAVAFAVLAASACSGTAAAPPRPLPVRPVPVPAPALRDAGWTTVESSRFFLTFPLPDGPTWRVDDRSDRWLVATHLPSRSMLWVRAWREGSVMTHARCEAQARSWRRDLLGRDESVLVDRRPLGAPSGFDTEVGFTVHRKGDALGGVAVAVGANVRRCLVVAYATRIEGPGAEQALGERLVFVTERIFARMEGRKIDDRVVPVPVR